MVLASLKPQPHQAYQQHLIVAFKERIDPAAFANAIEICLGKHDAVMAGFEFRSGDLFQTRLAQARLETREKNLAAEAGTSRERLARFLDQEAASPLPVGTVQPAWRSTLLHLNPNHWFWVWSHHHALCDGASYPILLEGLITIYDEIVGGHKPATRRALPSFFDHLAWLQKQDWQAQSRQWQLRLPQGCTLTRLPVIHRHRSRKSLRDSLAREPIAISPELGHELGLFADKIGISANTLFLAAWVLWLARTTDQEAVVIAAMRECRKSSIQGADSIVGPFANTVPLRVEVPDNLLVVDWLKKVQKEWHSLRPIEHCSLAQVARWSEFEIESAGLPCLFNFQRESLECQLTRLAIVPSRCQVELVQTTDIPLTVNGYGSPLSAEIVWRADILTDSVAKSAATGLSQSLRALVKNEAKPLGLIDLLSDEDRAAVKIASGGVRIQLQANLAHELIQRQIRQNANAAAIIFEDQILTYGDLGKLAEYFGARIHHGREPTEVVAVILPTGPDLVAVILAILQSGRPFF